MDSLQSLLPKVLHRRGLQKTATASLVTYRAQVWLEEKLPRFKGEVRPLRLTHSVLSIACSHSIAAQECQMLLPSLQSYLKQEYPGLVTEIRLLREGV